VTDRDRLKGMLIRHEGLKLSPYTCTKGRLTIGVGRNLDAVGISKNEAMVLLENDIDRAFALAEAFPWFYSLDEVRQDVVINMLFNMGLGKFKEFTKLISALERGRFELAAIEMLDSLWAAQVGGRATELAKMMKNGHY
jgi:lysozyme